MTMLRLNLLIFVIGVSLAQFTYAQDEIEIGDDGGSVHKGMVIVEPTNVVSTNVGGEYNLIPYRERRRRWGGTFAVDYSTYNPINYQPDFAITSFKDVYRNPDLPMIDISFTVKRNMAWGSLGGEFSVGFYKNISDNPNYVDSQLSLTPIKLGAIFFLDTLAPEPTVVPYISGGAYVAYYREELDATSLNGTTQAAPYVHGGLQFQLDWIDRAAARVAYHDSGIESSFFFIEARKQFASAKASDPDLSDDISFAGGLRVEF